MKARAEARKAKKKRKLDNDEDLLMHRQGYSDIVFGERAHAPPSLSIRPSVILFVLRANITLMRRHRKGCVDQDSGLVRAITTRHVSAKKSKGAHLSEFQCVAVTCEDPMTRALSS